MLIPTVKANNPVVGTLYFDPVSSAMTVWNGKVWKVVTNEILYCSLCKKADWSHAPYDMFDEINHPFFNNNLEYLEWASERQPAKR